MNGSLKKSGANPQGELSVDQNPWHMHSVIPLETVVRYGVPSVTSRTKGISAVVGFLVPFFGLFFRKKLGRLVGQFAGG